MRSAWIFMFLVTLLCNYSATAQTFQYPTTATANLSTSWTNTELATPSVTFPDGSILIRPILLSGTNGSNFACGFFCNGDCTSYLFSIFILQTDVSKQLNPFAYVYGDPQVVWSANRDHLVGLGATLNLTAAGDLVLQDVDSRVVWSSNTTGKSVAGLNLTDNGNLELFDVDNLTVWQSFDHPTDCLLPGQKLFQGQKLIPGVSSTNWTTQKGPSSYYLQVTDKGLFAYVESNPPQAYYSKLISGNDTSNERSYIRFLNGLLSFFIFSAEPSDPDGKIIIPEALSTQYMKLMNDGHLKVLQWQQGPYTGAWKEVADLFTDNIGECGYPLACGRNALCSDNQQCSCLISSSPRIDYFRALNDRQPNLGCSEITPLTCNATQDHDFIALENITYLTITAAMKNVNMQTCKQACLNNCSCKAALFNYNTDASSGECYLPSDLFTMKTFNPDNMNYNYYAFIKIQNVSSHPSPTLQSPGPFPKRKSQVATVLGSTIGSFLVVILVIVGSIMLIVRKRKRNIEMEEEYLDQVPGLPTWFSYEELKTATENFCKKLGEGGFGSVFQGTLKDGSKIAVKCLEGLAQVKKSFLAEVESIGAIHHVNLVRLIGFCAWKSQRLLLYEYMCHGSLDQWIYHGKREHVLEWECRKKIILDIAKGLAYLHEDCRQKIIHLDIKPQNILLDEHFNAKVSDFGLYKLIDRDQSQVMTTMRGTPGYLAPEWVSSVITEKMDVYSYGIVLLEMLCGRKNFDRSQPEESWHLLGVFQKCWEEGTLFDMVDRNSEDMQAHGIEVVETMKVASWCLQTNFTRRPSMSSVIKVLEGVMEVESNLDCNFVDPRLQKATLQIEKDLTPVLPSVVSGPR